MQNWFVFSIFALLIWGLWGFFPKIATQHLEPKSILVYETVGVLIVGLIVLAMLKFNPQVDRIGMAFAVLTGICGIAGAVFFLYALTLGKASIVVTMTALYPLITIILSYIFLGETITIMQGIGMVLAIFAIVLLSL